LCQIEESEITVVKPVARSRRERLAWTGLLAYPTVNAPCLPKGYPFSFSMSNFLVVSVHFGTCYLRKNGVWKEAQESTMSVIGGTVEWLWRSKLKMGGQGKVHLLLRP
jgi:hypothetical protein